MNITKSQLEVAARSPESEASSALGVKLREYVALEMLAGNRPRVMDWLDVLLLQSVARADVARMKWLVHAGASLALCDCAQEAAARLAELPERPVAGTWIHWHLGEAPFARAVSGMIPERHWRCERRGGWCTRRLSVAAWRCLTSLAHLLEFPAAKIEQMDEEAGSIADEVFAVNDYGNVDVSRGVPPGFARVSKRLQKRCIELEIEHYPALVGFYDGMPKISGIVVRKADAERLTVPKV